MQRTFKVVVIDGTDTQVNLIWNSVFVRSNFHFENRSHDTFSLQLFFIKLTNLFF